MQAMFKLCLLLLLFGSTIGTTPSSFDSIDKGYQNWVRQMGSGLGSGSSVYGSLFKKAKNRLKPCLRLRVSRKPREKVEIPADMAYVTVKGAGADKTVVEWDDTADRIGPNGRPMGTFASATFAVNSPFFIAKNNTFKNKAPLPASGALGRQAVVLHISADPAAFVGCRFFGSQDTLYNHVGRHYFRDCYVEGSVDFVFGNGLLFYQGCHLHAVSDSYGDVTARKRESLLNETGFSFVGCKVTGSGGLFLGRAWGTFSGVVFAHTYMDRIITPRRWYDWGDRNRDMTVLYGQYKCMGPGASFGGRVPWSRELTPEGKCFGDFISTAAMVFSL